MMNLFRSSRRTLSVMVTALAIGAAGCSTPSGPGAGSTTSEPPPETAGTSIEPTGPEVPRTGDDEVAISIPQLPIGGNSIPDGPGKQCASASWLQEEVLPDNGVKVKELQITPSDGYRAGGRCGGLPACASFTFRPGGGPCSVAVEGPGNPDDPQLTFKGEVTCAPGQENSCRELPTRVRPGLISLFQPGGVTEPESSTTEPPPSSAESSSTPTG